MILADELMQEILPDSKSFLANLEPEITLAINKPQSGIKRGFDSSAAGLFSLIAQGHSLLSATKALPMAYSKAWQLVKDLEVGFQIDLVEHHKGERGYRLTEHGHALLRTYESVHKSTAHWARDTYEHYAFDANGHD